MHTVIKQRVITLAETTLAIQSALASSGKLTEDDIDQWRVAANRMLPGGHKAGVDDFADIERAVFGAPLG